MVIYMSKINILIVGVGGQGIILLSSIIGKAAVDAKLDVVIGETKGLARRGGTVEAHVKIGDSYSSPLIPKGCANVVLALEFLEGLRYIPWLSRGGYAIISAEKVHPINTFMYEEKYPPLESVIQVLKGLAEKYDYKIFIVNPVKYAVKLGNPLTSNIIMLGFLNKVLKLLNDNHIVNAIKSSVPKRTIDENIRAYYIGVDYANEILKKKKNRIVIDV